MSVTIIMIISVFRPSKIWYIRLHHCFELDITRLFEFYCLFTSQVVMLNNTILNRFQKINLCIKMKNIKSIHYQFQCGNKLFQTQICQTISPPPIIQMKVSLINYWLVHSQHIYQLGSSRISWIQKICSECISISDIAQIRR